MLIDLFILTIYIIINKIIRRVRLNIRFQHKTLVPADIRQKQSVFLISFFPREFSASLTDLYCIRLIDKH